jgi:CheY-like chemotaxis protein
MISVFLSHSSRDKDFVRRLAVDLQRSGFEVWFDEWEILVGDSISQRISAGLDKSAFVVVALSSHSVASGWVEKEWHSKVGTEARAREVAILPILLEHCRIPSLLADKRYADFSDDYQLGLATLVSSLRGQTRRRFSRPLPGIPPKRGGPEPATVLIVDDEGRFAIELERIFAGYRPAVNLLLAKDAGEGLRLFAAKAPDVLILDIMMPYGDASLELEGATDPEMLETGIRLLRKIKVAYPAREFWIFVVTARSPMALAELPRLLGERGRVYFKPFSLFDLECDVTEALGIPPRFPKDWLDQLRDKRGT